MLRAIAALSRRRGPAGKTMCQEQNNFAAQVGRRDYKTIAERGWPVGRGAVESACGQYQCPEKRPGQFSSQTGLRHLDALQEARDHGHWHQLWLST
jgi:hypothetical protein